MSIDRLYQYKPGKNSVTEPRVFHYFRQRPSTPVVEEEGLSRGSLIEIEARGVERYTTYAYIYIYTYKDIVYTQPRQHAQDQGMSSSTPFEENKITKIGEPFSIVRCKCSSFTTSA